MEHLTQTAKGELIDPETGELLERPLPAFQRGPQAEFRHGPGEPRLGVDEKHALPRTKPGRRWK